MDKLYIIGSIDEESFAKFSEELAEIERKSRRVVEVEMNSFGGCGMDALAFYDRIKASKCEINITVYGYVASAAVLVFAACNQRRMGANSWMMVHEDEDTLKNVRTSTVKRQGRQMDRFEEQWCHLLAINSKINSLVWRKYHAEETYLDAQECLSLGIATKILGE